MATRSGKKIRGTHRTGLELSGKVFDIIEKLNEVTGITLGIIVPGTGSSGAIRRIKISSWTGGIQLHVQQARSIQIMLVFCEEEQRAKLAISRALRNNDISICFR